MGNILLPLLLVVIWTGSTIAAEVNLVDGRYEGQKYVSISGQILEGDLQKVQRVAKEAIQYGNNGLALLINTGGGDAIEAMKIGRFARELLATTYVYGKHFYTSGTPEGEEAEALGLKYSQIRFHNIPVASGSAIKGKDVVRCYSAGVLIFYGGVDRYASDNIDDTAGLQNRRLIPVIGLHRPYYDKNQYSSLSPIAAKRKYGQLEKKFVSTCWKWVHHKLSLIACFEHHPTTSI